MTANKMKHLILNYKNSITKTEWAIFILNFCWLILNIISLVLFRIFYSSNKAKYGNIYNIKNALYIIEDPNYNHLMTLGIIVIGVCVIAVIFSSIFLVNNNEDNRVITNIIVIISLILNLSIATFSIGYFIIGVVLVGIFAAGATFMSE